MRKTVKSKARPVALLDVLWQLLPAGVLLTVFASVGVMHVMSRVRVVDSGYRLSLLQGKNQELMLDNDRLKLELATLKNPSRLEKVAREQLGLGPPPAGAVLTVTTTAALARRLPFLEATSAIKAAPRHGKSSARLVAERSE